MTEDITEDEYELFMISDNENIKVHKVIAFFEINSIHGTCRNLFIYDHLFLILKSIIFIFGV